MDSQTENTLPAELNLSFPGWSFLTQLVSHQREVQIRHLTQRVLLTAQFDPNEVSDAQVFQEDSRGWGGFKQKGDVCAQFAVKGGEVEVRCLLVEKCSIPDIFCKWCTAIKCVCVSAFVQVEERTFVLWWHQMETHTQAGILVTHTGDKVTLDLLSPWQRRCPRL